MMVVDGLGTGSDQEVKGGRRNDGFLTREIVEQWFDLDRLFERYRKGAKKPDSDDSPTLELEIPPLSLKERTVPMNPRISIILRTVLIHPMIVNDKSLGCTDDSKVGFL